MEIYIANLMSVAIVLTELSVFIQTQIQTRSFLMLLVTYVQLHAVCKPFIV